MNQQSTTEHKFSPVDRTAALLRMLSLIRDMGRTGTAEIQLMLHTHGITMHSRSIQRHLRRFVELGLLECDQCSPKGFWWAEKSRHLKETAVAVIESLEAA